MPGCQHPPWVAFPRNGRPLHPKQRAQSMCALAGESCSFPLAALATSVQWWEAGLQAWRKEPELCPCCPSPTPHPPVLLLHTGTARSELVMAGAS